MPPNMPPAPRRARTVLAWAAAATVAAGAGCVAWQATRNPVWAVFAATAVIAAVAVVVVVRMVVRLPEARIAHALVTTAPTSAPSKDAR